MTTPDPLEQAAQQLSEIVSRPPSFEPQTLEGAINRMKYDAASVVRVYLTAAVEQMPVEVVRDLAIGLDCLYLPREEGEAKALVLSALLPRGEGQ